MPNTLEDSDWELLLERISDGKCTPFLGAGACYPSIPLGSQLAEEWARASGYPLEDPWNLAHVAQFVAVTKDPMAPKERMVKRFEQISLPDFQAPDEPHGVLADLPLPVYLTTNYDDFMVEALKSRHRDPRQELCRWNSYVQNLPSVFDRAADFDPNAANPVVFHLHGHVHVPESLVLTEDDYLDFMIGLSKDPDLLPSRIRQALSGASLLFLGYSIADWDFRVLFRSIVSYLERSIARAHVSVQLVPGSAEVSAADRDRIQKYLDRYFAKLEIRIFWGTAREFVGELRRRWDQFRQAAGSGDGD